MISVDQIHHLEKRVERVLGMLAKSREENTSVAAQLQAAKANAEETARRLEASESARLAAEQRLLDLEGKLSQLRTDQEEIEATINRTLHQLDEADSPPAPVPAESAPAEDVAAPAPAVAPAAAAEERSDETDAAATGEDTTGEEAAPSREGAELDIF